MTQTAVRIASLPHVHVNGLLPLTLAAMRARDRAAFERLDAALARPVEALADELRQHSELADLGQLAADPELLDRTVAAAVRRPELARVTPAMEHDEVLAIYRAAAFTPNRPTDNRLTARRLARLAFRLRDKLNRCWSAAPRAACPRRSVIAVKDADQADAGAAAA